MNWHFHLTPKHPPAAADLPRLAQVARQVVAVSDPADFTQIDTWSHYQRGRYHFLCSDLSAAEQHLLPLVMHPHASSIWVRK